jgi:hypothetical protein
MVVADTAMSARMVLIVILLESKSEVIDVERQVFKDKPEVRFIEQNCWRLPNKQYGV